jgi:hypothetical protein
MSFQGAALLSRAKLQGQPCCSVMRSDFASSRVLDLEIYPAGILNDPQNRAFLVIGFEHNVVTLSQLVRL